MNAKWEMLIPGLIVGAALLSSLVTGKALNPLRGMRPMIVGRDQEPGRYWASVAINVAFLAVAVAIAWAAFSN